MTAPLLIVGCGAITAVGLTAAQTCAATRARLSRFEQIVYFAPPAEPVTVATVPAAQRLKRSPAEWLVNMAELALRDCLSEIPTYDRRIALVLSLPDAHRQHPAFSAFKAAQLLNALQGRLQMSFHPLSSTLNDGHAAVIKGFAVARHLFATSDVDLRVVGGVDSLLNEQDVKRLQTVRRLHDERNPQGVIPGEGAGFVALGRPGATFSVRPVAQVLGWGTAVEKDTILGDRFSTGTCLREALEIAVEDSACPEPKLSFRNSDMNGERYRAWESLVCGTRFYRTRREHLQVWATAASTGDLGAASGALTVIAAAFGINRGYAPGPYAACETSSDNGLRAACILAPAPGGRTPPFRTRTAWAQ